MCATDTLSRSVHPRVAESEDRGSPPLSVVIRLASARFRDTAPVTVFEDRVLRTNRLPSRVSHTRTPTVVPRETFKFKAELG